MLHYRNDLVPKAKSLRHEMTKLKYTAPSLNRSFSIGRIDITNEKGSLHFIVETSFFCGSIFLFLPFSHR